MTPVPVKKAILFAAAGTSYADAMKTFEGIGLAAAARFPGIPQRWAYTSSGVRRKLAARGVHVDDPAQALAAMTVEGFTHIAVLSLHLAEGMEYRELAETVRSHSDRAKLSLPFLTNEQDARRILSALLASLPAEVAGDDAIILVAHGSLEPKAIETLHATVSLCRQVDRRLNLGMILGSPSLRDIVADCKAASVKKVWLVPFLLSAGFSVQEEIAGAGEKTWKTTLEQAGFKCVPVFKGLGDVDGIVRVWLDRLEKLL